MPLFVTENIYFGRKGTAIMTLFTVMGSKGFEIQTKCSPFLKICATLPYLFCPTCRNIFALKRSRGDLIIVP